MRTPEELTVKEIETLYAIGLMSKEEARRLLGFEEVTDDKKDVRFGIRRS